MIALATALFIGCQATSCQVMPCSKSESAENGQHQADDAAPPQLSMPVGCDPSMPMTP